jgi:hypothetical protein
MTSQKMTIADRGILSGEGRKRECRFSVTRTSLDVDELQTPGGWATSTGGVYRGLNVDRIDLWVRPFFRFSRRGLQTADTIGLRVREFKLRVDGALRPFFITHNCDGQHRHKPEHARQ